MKHSILALVTLLIIEISLSDAAVRKDGVYERTPIDRKKAISDREIAVDDERGQKRSPSKISVVPKRVDDAEGEEIEIEDEVAKERSPKRRATTRTKSIPKPTPKKAPTTKVVAPREELDDPADDDIELESDVNEKPMPPSQKDPANSIASSNVLQQLMLQMKNLSSNMENLQSLLRNNMPQIFGSASNSESVITDNNMNQAPVLPTFPGFAVTSLTSCGIHDENFDNCLKDYLRDAIKKSKNGNSQFSIPQLDPYYFPHVAEIKMPFENFKMELMNLRIFGYSRAKINQVHDWANGFIEINFVVPEAKCIGQYYANGVVTLGSNKQAINANGLLFEVALIDLSHRLKIEAEVQDNANGKKYVHIKSVDVLLDLQKMTMRFDNVFGDNKKKNGVFNKKINDNWSRIFRAAQPGIQKAMSESVFKLLSDFFEAVPFNEVFHVDY